jgi:hypothetical protein
MLTLIYTEYKYRNLVWIELERNKRDPETLELERSPHIGGVVIGNNVELYANSSIARGSFSDTIIGDGTKLDAFIYTIKVL